MITTLHIIILVTTVFINTLVLGILNHKEHKKIIKELTKKIDERKQNR